MRTAAIAMKDQEIMMTMMIRYRAALGIAAENLFEVFNREKFGANSPTRKGTPRILFI